MVYDRCPAALRLCYANPRPSGRAVEHTKKSEDNVDYVDICVCSTCDRALSIHHQTCSKSKSMQDVLWIIPYLLMATERLLCTINIWHALRQTPDRGFCNSDRYNAETYLVLPDTILATQAEHEAASSKRFICDWCLSWVTVWPYRSSAVCLKSARMSARVEPRSFANTPFTYWPRTQNLVSKTDCILASEHVRMYWTRNAATCFHKLSFLGVRWSYLKRMHLGLSLWSSR